MELPTFATLLNQRTVVDAKGEYCLVDQHMVRELLRPRVERIFLDVDWYLRIYSDVTLAIKQAVVPSARHHYVWFGYYENRLPYRIEVDETWYLDQYPDIREAIAAQTVTSAQRHFELTGFGEGRLPFPGFQLRTR